MDDAPQLPPPLLPLLDAERMPAPACSLRQPPCHF
jgi:hypothetical protein